MDEKDRSALSIVTYWLRKKIGRTPSFDCFIIWKAKVLQNWKYIIGTNLPDNEMYEVTYDGFRHFWYLSAYKEYERTKYMDDTVRAEILRKVEL